MLLHNDMTFQGQQQNKKQKVGKTLSVTDSSSHQEPGVSSPNKNETKNQPNIEQYFDLDAVYVLGEEDNVKRMKKQGDAKKTAFSPEYFGAKDGCAWNQLPQWIRDQYTDKRFAYDVKSKYLVRKPQEKSHVPGDEVCPALCHN
jgi:hypothetical protein